MKLSGFSGLRGVAALIVIVYHLNQRLPLGGISPPGYDLHLFLTHGSVMVSVFFMLSGFFRSLSYWKVIENGGVLPGFFSSLKDRFFRIAPAYYVVLILSLVVSYLFRGSESIDWKAFFVGFTFFSWISPETLFPVLLNGPLWFLSYDMMGWIMTSFFMMSIARIRKKYWIFFALFVIGLMLGLHFLWISLPLWDGAKNIFGWFPIYNPFLFFLHFLFGIGAAYVVMLISKKMHDKTCRIFDYLSGALLISLLFLIWCIRDQGEWVSFPRGPYHFPWVTLMIALLFVTLPFTRYVAKWLDNRFLLFSGQISYSLYLIHVLWVVILGDTVFSNTSLSLWIVYSLSVLGLSYVSAWFLYRYVELPCVKK